MFQGTCCRRFCRAMAAMVIMATGIIIRTTRGRGTLILQATAAQEITTLRVMVGRGTTAVTGTATVMGMAEEGIAAITDARNTCFMVPLAKA